MPLNLPNDLSVILLKSFRDNKLLTRQEIKTLNRSIFNEKLHVSAKDVIIFLTQNATFQNLNLINKFLIKLCSEVSDQELIQLFESFRESSAPNKIFMQAQLQVLILKKPDEQEVFDLYKFSANKGFAPARYVIARMYEIGFNGVVNADKEIAIKHYKKAAQQKYSPSQYYLGRIFEIGIKDILEANPHEAKKLYLEAAANGHDLASRTLKQLDKVSNKFGISVNKVFSNEIKMPGLCSKNLTTKQNIKLPLS